MDCPRPLYGRYITLQKLEPQTDRNLCLRIASAFISIPLNGNLYQMGMYWL